MKWYIVDLLRYLARFGNGRMLDIQRPTHSTPVGGKGAEGRKGDPPPYVGGYEEGDAAVTKHSGNFA